MIRSKNKIHGEVNDPDTALATVDIYIPKYLVGSGNKGLRNVDHATPGVTNQILIVNADGTIGLLSFDEQHDKLIATNEVGDIVLIDRGAYT